MADSERATPMPRVASNRRRASNCGRNRL